MPTRLLPLRKEATKVSTPNRINSDTKSNQLSTKQVHSSQNSTTPFFRAEPFRRLELFSFVPMKHAPSLASLVALLVWAGLLTLNKQAAAQCTTWDAPTGLMVPTELTEAERPTRRAESAVGLRLDGEQLRRVRGEELEGWRLVLPIPGRPKAVWELRRFTAYAPGLLVGRTGADGFKEELAAPQLQTFRVVAMEEHGRRHPQAGGIVALMADEVVGSLRLDGEVFEIAPVGDGGLHATYRLADSKLESNFSCAAEDLAFNQMRQSAPRPGTRTVANPVVECVEVALDIDHHTYNSFGAQCSNTVEWALALLAGVSEIYVDELGNVVNLQASYVHVWEVTDPYAAYVQNAGSMLDAFRSEWVSNPALSGIDRDLVHLLTRRTNTGTGGIAYLDVVCSTQFAVGFSSYLTGTSSYTGDYSWNLNELALDLGTNIGE